MHSMKHLTIRVSLLPAALFLAALAGGPAAAQSIVHQVALSGSQAWCADGTINGMLAQINNLRAANGAAALNFDTLGMKDAETRVTQYAAYLAANSPFSASFNPYQGYDTTAAG